MSLLDEFKFPDLDQTAKDFLSQDFKFANNSNGVGTLQTAGHDKKGMSYRFFLHPVKAQAASEIFDMEINNDIQMVQWFKDRDHKPVERALQLPDGLLKFAKKRVSYDAGIAQFEFIVRYTDPVDGKVKEDIESAPRSRGLKYEYIAKSGEYLDAYTRWRQGLEAEGLSLSKWGELTVGEVATLNAEGIFSVQQLACLPDDRVEGRWPKNLTQAFNKAIHWCNSESRKADVAPYANEVLAVKQENKKLLDKMIAMQEQIDKLQSQPKVPERPRQERPRKSKLSERAEMEAEMAQGE